MCPPISANIAETVAQLGLPESFSAPLVSYGAILVCRLVPQCIILYGSLVKGTYTTASDIDLVVIAKPLPASFWDRLALLQELNQARHPMDAFAYTPEEFRQMLEHGHVTALDALADGVPVYGDRYFSRLREVFQDMVRRGLHRSTCSWVLPRPA